MRIPASKTLAGWAVIGAGAVAAALYVSVPERNVPGWVASSPAQVTAPAVAPPRDSLADLLANARRAPLPRKGAGDPFAGRAPAPATQVQAAPIPAMPVVPPFPFKYAGWFQEGRGSTKVYLSRGNTVFPIRAGDVLEGFRIDAVQHERIEVTFLASGQQLSFLLASLTGAADGATFAKCRRRGGFRARRIAGSRPRRRNRASAGGCRRSTSTSTSTSTNDIARRRVDFSSHQRCRKCAAVRFNADRAGARLRAERKAWHRAYDVRQARRRSRAERKVRPVKGFHGQATVVGAHRCSDFLGSPRRKGGSGTRGRAAW